MSIRPIYCDGFDHYVYTLGGTLLKWDSIGITGTATGSYGNSSTIAAGNGRPSLSDTNTGGLNVIPGLFFGTAGSITYTKNFGAQLATFYFGTAIKINNPGPVAVADCIIAAFQDATNTQVDLRLKPDGTFYFTRNGTTLGSASPNALSFNQWYYLEVKIVINSSTGSVELRINGTSTGWISLTGQNTQATANAYCTRFWVGGANLGGSSPCCQINYDDLIVNTVQFLGDLRVSGQMATGNGTLNQWSRVVAAWPAATAVVRGTQILDSNGKVQEVTSISGSGTTAGSAPTWNTVTGGTTTDNAGVNQVIWTNRGAAADWQAVSELPNPDNDFSYLVDGTVGHITRFTFPAIAGSSVIAVVGWPFADKDDAGARAIRVVTLSGGTQGDNGSDITMGSSYAYQMGVLDVDPNTGVPWTVAGVNAAEFGTKVIS
jgi:hypothetical protein